LKIAVNTRLLLKDKLEGIGWFSYENLKRITQQHKEHQFIFIFDRKYDDSFIFSDNIEPVVAIPQARHPVLYYAWFEFAIPRVLKKHKPDLFLSPDGYLSLSTRVKSMNVFHDLNFEHYPDDLPRAERWYYQRFFPRYAEKACRIATVSEFSKRDIINQYNIDPNKIDVVYNGANESYTPIDDEAKTLTRQKLTGGKPYFIFIGALHPRKNLVNMFRAFDHFKQTNDSDLKLLIVGNKKWWTPKIKDSYEQMMAKDEVIFAGRLSAGDLHHALAAAHGLTYVSYFEGFGIPILEAFYCNVPVITSNLTSMPEVAGDAALLVDPFSVESISDGMKKMTFDLELRQQLIERSVSRRKQFSWQKSSEKLWSSIEKALGS